MEEGLEGRVCALWGRALRGWGGPLEVGAGLPPLQLPLGVLWDRECCWLLCRVLCIQTVPECFSRKSRVSSCTEMLGNSVWRKRIHSFCLQ